MYKNILVPLDGSKLAEVALPYAEEFAVKFNAGITLLRVIEYTPEGVIPKDGVMALETIEQQYIDKLRQELTNKGIDARAEIRVGDPTKEISKFASKDKTDMIIMAARGKSDLRQWSPGDTADTVVRAANQFILLIRVMENLHKSPKLHLLGKVLVPLDGSKEAETAVPYVEDLAVKLGMEIILFMVVKKGSHVYPVNGDGAYRIVPFSKEQIKMKKRDARAYLEAVAESPRSLGIQVKTEVTYGDVAKDIVKFGDRFAVNMVAMSYKERFGSVANRFLREGSNHLLLIKT